VILIILVSVGLHVGAAIVAGIFIVARYFREPVVEFKATKDVRLPAKKREAKMNMASLDAIAPKPTFTDRMQSSRPTAFSLPEMPSMPMDQMIPLDPAQLVSDQISSLANVSALGSGSGTGETGGGGFGDKGMSFLGIQANGERILLVFDVSSSVTRKAEQSGIPLKKIQEETLNLIQKLPITSKFGLIQFTQNYKNFSKDLVPATDSNRVAAQKWVQTEWEEKGSMSASEKGVVSNPRGIVGVLELAAAMKPDLLYVISDGSFQSKVDGPNKTIPWDDVKKVVNENFTKSLNCRINFITFQAKKDDAKELKNLSTKSGGKTLEIK
jgi:hypothetical protein